MSTRSQEPQCVHELWSAESMEAAIKAVKEGMGIREAARLYSIPHETLSRRMAGIVSVHCKPAPSTLLTKEEEVTLPTTV